MNRFSGSKYNFLIKKSGKLARAVIISTLMNGWMYNGPMVTIICTLLLVLQTKVEELPCFIKYYIIMETLYQKVSSNLFEKLKWLTLYYIL